METDSIEQSGKPITRKDALKKAGKYAAFTAASAITLLAPRPAQAESIDKTGKGWGDGSYTPPPGPGPSPFDKSEKKSNSSNLRDSPWK